MGWQDAPLVTGQPSRETPAWMQAPLVSQEERIAATEPPAPVVRQPIQQPAPPVLPMPQQQAQPAPPVQQPAPPPALKKRFEFQGTTYTFSADHPDEDIDKFFEKKRAATQKQQFIFRGTTYNFEPDHSKEDIDKFFDGKREEIRQRKDPFETSAEHFARGTVSQMSTGDLVKWGRSRGILVGPHKPRETMVKKARELMLAERAETRLPEEVAADEEIIEARQASIGIVIPKTWERTPEEVDEAKAVVGWKEGDDGGPVRDQIALARLLGSIPEAELLPANGLTPGMWWRGSQGDVYEHTNRGPLRVSQEKIRKRAAQEDDALYAKGVLEQSSVPRARAAFEQLATTVESKVSRLGGRDQRADELNRTGSAFAAAAEPYHEKSWSPLMSRAASGVASTLPSMIAAGVIAGPLGAIADAATTEANQAITTGRDAGLKGVELAGFAARAGTIEAVPALIMQKVGLGGVEALFGKAGRQAVNKGLLQGLKKAGITTIQEIPEEIVTEVGHSVNQFVSNVDKDALSADALSDTVAQTVAQTILTVGLLESPNVARSAKAGRDRAKRIKQLTEAREKGPVSRKDGRALALPEGDMKSQKTRTAAVDEEIQQTEREIQDAGTEEKTGEVAQEPKVPVAPQTPVEPPPGQKPDKSRTKAGQKPDKPETVPTTPKQPTQTKPVSEPVSEPETPRTAAQEPETTPKALADYSSMTVKQLTAEAKSKGKKYGASNKVVSQSEYDKEKENIRRASRGEKLLAGIDPSLLKSAVKIGLYHAEAGARSFTDWSAKMVADFGESVRENLPKLWDKISARPDSAEPITEEEVQAIVRELGEPQEAAEPQLPEGKREGKAPPVAEGGKTDAEEFSKDPSSGVDVAATVPIVGHRGSVGRSAKSLLRRFFTAPGELPTDVYDAKVRKEGRVAKEMTKLRHAATDFGRGLRKAMKGQKLTQADAEKINTVLRGEADMATVPEEIRAPLQAFRDHIDSLSRRFVAEGVAQGDLVGIITKHYGVYATRSYRIFDDPKHRDKVPKGVRNRAVAAIREMHPDKSNAEIQGILESLLFRGAADSPVALLKGSKLGSKDMGILMRRKDVPEWLRELWGEYKDAGVNYARSVFKMAHLLANHQFLNEVREAGLGKWLRTKEDGPIVSEYGEVITPIAADDSSVMAPLNGLYTTPEIKAAFEELDSPGAMPDWLRVLMSVNYAVKYGKTVGSAMTHVRNYISNFGFMVANGHWRVDKYGKALMATVTGTFQLPSAEFRAYYERKVELGLVGEDVRAGELKDAMRDSSRMDIDDLLYSSAALPAKKIVKAGRAGFRVLNALYQAEDALPKLYAHENEMARYAKAHPEWSLEHLEEYTAKIVRDTYPTYSKIGAGIKAIRRFPLVGPFVSFSAEVARTTFNTIHIGLQEMQAPETRAIGAQRLVGTTIALGGLSVLSKGVMAILGIGDDEDEDLRWFVPPWQENSRFIYTSKPKDATYRYIDLGYSDPHATLTDSVVAFMRGENWRKRLIDSTAEFLSPFTSEEILSQALLDLRSNEDQKIYNPKDTVGEQAKDIAWHLWSKAMEPGTITSARRILTAVEGTDPSRETSREVLAVTTGQRLQKVDVEHSLGFRVRDFAKALTSIQGIARKTATSRGKATGGMVATDLARMEKLRLAEFAEMQQMLGAARRLGVPENNIRTLLEDELPDDVAEQLVAGDYSPYEMTPQTVQQMLKASPEQFMERFAAWHGAKLPEAVKTFARPLAGNIPTKPPPKDDKTDFEYKRAVEKHKEKLRSTKQTFDAMGISHAKAQELLLDYYQRPGEDGKPNPRGHVIKGSVGTFKPGYRSRKAALVKLYGK